MVHHNIIEMLYRRLKKISFLLNFSHIYYHIEQ